MVTKADLIDEVTKLVEMRKKDVADVVESRPAHARGNSHRGILVPELPSRKATEGEAHGKGGVPLASPRPAGRALTRTFGVL